MELTGKRVLVTGGAGMIGAQIVRDLEVAGAKPATLSRSGATVPGSSAPAAKGDITDPAALDFSDFDAVVHAAAFVGFGLTAEKEQQMLATNVGGTKNVLDAAADAGCKKVLHVSSVAAIGETHDGAKGEDWVWQRPQHFQSMYERSKYEAHKLALAYDGVDVASIMPSVVIGLGDTSSGRLLKLHLERRLPVLVDHPGRIGVVHVRDVSAGALAALQRGTGAYVLSETAMTVPVLFRTFEAATGVPAPKRIVPYGLLRIAIPPYEAALHLLRKRAPFSKDFVRSLGKDHLFDSSRAKEELGWAPDLRAGLAKDAEEWRAATDTA